VTREHEGAVVHAHVEHVALADAEGVAEIGGEHHPTERVDAPGAVLRAHANRQRLDDIRSVL
jgi:hypothetical protein